jgi:nitrite reductase/ring-hydroxylating ferredoxin subunit
MTAWVTVANVEDLPQGETLGVTVDGTDVLVVNLRDRYVEIGAARTHAGLPPQHDIERDLEQAR